MRIRSAVVTVLAAAGAAALAPQPAAADPASSPAVSSLTESEVVGLLRIPLSESNVKAVLGIVETTARPLNMEKGASLTGK
ncbi:hypothetical protein A6A06_35310 [Streptomyces sp. CB02923]|uniref:hypothetical protein n=1 Tax=Streptomyces sp. CB02923 TaxID=1718985 RepID=UPI000962F3F7|nr:hypothetical protein [Streptomyces sp. CB02923]OKI08118.1 hypothetical protein A6A06_35310 [Streptomyces sp. CB02923]